MVIYGARRLTAMNAEAEGELLEEALRRALA